MKKCMVFVKRVVFIKCGGLINKVIKYALAIFEI